jgi:hypothetical protein
MTGVTVLRNARRLVPPLVARAGARLICETKGQPTNMMSFMKSVQNYFRMLSRPFTTNYEDIKILTESMLLVTALVMTFVFNGIQTIDHDNLMEADSRFLKHFNCTTAAACHLPSLNYVECLMSSMKYLVIVLVLGLAIYLSLAFSKCAENPEVWPYWSKGFSVGIIFGYALLVYAVVLLLLAGRALADMVLPLYSFNASNIYDPISGQVVEGEFGWILQLRYQEATLSMIICSVCTAAAVFVSHIISMVMSEVACSRGEKFKYILPFPEDSTLFRQYERVFRREKLTMKQITQLSPKELKSLGIPYGHALSISEHLKPESLLSNTSNSSSP